MGKKASEKGQVSRATPLDPKLLESPGKRGWQAEEQALLSDEAQKTVP